MRLSKMEAVTELGIMLSHLKKDLERHRRQLKDPPVADRQITREDWIHYEERTLAELDRQVSALEMAGRAMTK